MLKIYRYQSYQTEDLLVPKLLRSLEQSGKILGNHWLIKLFIGVVWFIFIPYTEYYGTQQDLVNSFWRTAQRWQFLALTSKQTKSMI